MFGPTTRLLFHFCGMLIGLVAVGSGFAVWRLSQGPVSLAILAPYVEEALTAGHPGFHLYFDDLLLSWQGWERTFGIRAIGVRAYRSDASAMAGVPEMDIQLSIPALARGLIAPTQLELFGPSVRLVRRADGVIDLGFTDRAGDNGATVGKVLFGDLLRPLDRNRATGYLRRISIIEGRLSVRDEGLDLDWSAPVERLVLERHESGIKFATKMSLPVGESLVDVTIAAVGGHDQGRFDLAVEFEGLNPAALAAAYPSLAGLAGIDLTIAGRIDVVTNADGEIARIAFTLDGGRGSLALPLPIAPAALRDIRGVHAAGTFDSDLGALDLTALEIDFGGPALTMRGRFTGDWSAPDMTAVMHLSNVPIDDFADYWPASVAPGGRIWVVERISAGTVDDMTVTLDLTGADWLADTPPRDSVIGEFRLSGAEIAYLPGLPPVIGADAVGRFDAVGLSATVSGGTAGPLSLRAAEVTVDTEAGDHGLATVTVSFAGPLSETLAALDRPPFGYLAKTGLDASAITGRVEGELTVTVPLVDAPSLDSIAISLGADLYDLAIAESVLGGAVAGGLRDAEAALLLDIEGFDLSGEGMLAGILASFHWRENFPGTSADARRRIDVSAVIDDHHRAIVGLDSPAITGPVAIELRLIEGLDGTLTGELDADAIGARLEVPALGWIKLPGADAEARFALEWEHGALVRLPRFGVLAEGLSAAGAAARDGDGVWTISFDRLAAGFTDVRGSVRIDAAGHRVIGITGASLDLRPFMASAEAVGKATGTAPTVLDAAVDLVVVDDHIFLHRVTAKAEHDGLRLTRASLDFSLGKADDLSFRLASADAGHRVAILDSAKAGAVLAALGLTRNVVGGALHIEALIDDTPGQAPITGVIEIEDFHVIDAPVLARIFNIVSITGALELLGGKGIPFVRLNAPFTYDGSVLRFTNARANGMSLGLTMEGEIDFDGDTVDLAGTIVPVYALNRILGNIPLIGDLLTGGEGKGVFAVTYAIEGPRDRPLVVINPLAALAPGILREMITGAKTGEAVEAGDRESIGGRQVR